ncbi:hypothetical protein [Rhodovulum sulfidophilum]|uniref:hypothetical protein n=1 Tax=Rhodovulum sulfidophilum TaxID=35806 RepID=UPI001F30A4EE|nr:hypothetical protein [Rhodovulum sulfidophilum]
MSPTWGLAKGRAQGRLEPFAHDLRPRDRPVAGHALATGRLALGPAEIGNAGRDIRGLDHEWREGVAPSPVAAGR